MKEMFSRQKLNSHASHPISPSSLLDISTGIFAKRALVDEVGRIRKCVQR
jgi:hypothetical protein